MAYILIVDDDEDFASAAAKVLGGAGHDVQIEMDPQRAIPRMEQRPPDLIVLDVMFPEDSTAGFELARTIRRHDKLKGALILMLTAVNVRFPLGFSNADVDEAWLPVTDFLEKPVDFDVLKDKVASLLASVA